MRDQAHETQRRATLGLQPDKRDERWMDAAAISWADMRALAVDAHGGYGGIAPKYSSGYEAGHELSYDTPLQDAADSSKRAFGDYLVNLGLRLHSSVPLTGADLDMIAVHVDDLFGGGFKAVRPHIKHGQTDLAGWNPDALAVIHIESIHPGAMGPGGRVDGVLVAVVLTALSKRLNLLMDIGHVRLERTNSAVLSVVAL